MKEVIVSGGVFGSPQLLQASGIGPTELLSQHSIPIVADRPGVGQGMQDHIYYTVMYRVNAPILSKLGDPAFAVQQAAAFIKTGGGMYSNPVTEVIGWEKIPQPLRSQTMSNGALSILSQYPADWPEIEYIPAAGFVGYQNSSTAAPTDGSQLRLARRRPYHTSLARERQHHLGRYLRQPSHQPQLPSRSSRC